MNDEPKLRYQGDWEKIKHITKIIETEYENESMALWAAEAIFQYVNENPAVSVHYIRREKAKAWGEAIDEARARLLIGSMDEEELRDANPYQEETG